MRKLGNGVRRSTGQRQFHPPGDHVAAGMGYTLDDRVDQMLIDLARNTGDVKQIPMYITGRGKVEIKATVRTTTRRT